MPGARDINANRPSPASLGRHSTRFRSDEESEAQAEAGRLKISDCDVRLARYRKTLDAGADAIVVAGWMSEVQGERLRPEEELGEAVPSGKVSEDQIRRLVVGLRDVAVLATPTRRIRPRCTPKWVFK